MDMEAIMKTKAITGVCVSAALAGSSALGGTVSFDPPVREVDPSISTVTTFEVGIAASDLGTFEGLDMVIGSDDLQIVRWDYGDYTRFFEDVRPAGIYPSDVRISHFALPTAMPFSVGEVTVDAAGLPPGLYQVVVDAERDNVRSRIQLGLAEDPLYGEGFVSVIPEPGTLALLALGALGLAWRRQRSETCSSSRVRY